MNHLALCIALTMATGVTLWPQGQPDYLCTITKVDDPLSSNVSAALKANRKYKIGATFTVKRATGVMTGALKNSYVTVPMVVDLGSSENSYKVVTTMKLNDGAGAGTSAYLLIVKEWADASKKPFAFFDGDYVYSGYAVHIK